jgi:uncharacterized protein YndB with AHSA1/START domain/effector-binding domain-containing protein
MKGTTMRFFPDSFKVSTPDDRSIHVERDFNARRALVFDAFTTPELVRRWLLGPDGWTMPVCEIDLRVGGRYRYVWRKEAIGKDMAMGGVFRQVVRPARLVATEKFDDAWYPGEAVNTTTFEERDGVTSVRVVVLYESKEARDTASRSGMERGMIAGYDRLEALLASDMAGGLPQHLVDAPVVADTAPRLAAAIHVTIPRSEIRSVIGPGLTEIMAAVTAQGIGPAGPWFTHHFAMHPATFDFEICVPVSAPVKPVGRVVSREMPASRVVRAVYQGPYEQLSEGWKEFDSWMAEHGHAPAPDLYECYTVGPDSSPDPASWRTELSRPIAMSRASTSTPGQPATQSHR